MRIEKEIISVVDTLKSLEGFVNSTFVTSLFGAFAGAYGGQFIVEKIKNRETLLTEIRNTNAAVLMTFDICHSYILLKQQHVGPLKETFDKQREDLNTFQAGVKSGQIPDNEIFQFEADLKTCETMFVPIEVLQKLIFEKISLDGRPLILNSNLIRAVQSLNNAIQKRNQLIEGYRAKTPMQSKDFATQYFGLPYSGGHIDNNYPSCVEFIYKSTDDCIFFSKLLCEDLVAHGEQLKKKFGEDAPKIYTPNFNKAVEFGLIPDESKYSDWTNLFVKADAKNS